MYEVFLGDFRRTPFPTYLPTYDYLYGKRFDIGH
jgi:hypothetical protein